MDPYLKLPMTVGGLATLLGVRAEYKTQKLKGYRRKRKIVNKRRKLAGAIFNLHVFKSAPQVSELGADVGQRAAFGC